MCKPPFVWQTLQSGPSSVQVRHFPGVQLDPEQGILRCSAATVRSISFLEITKRLSSVAFGGHSQINKKQRGKIGSLRSRKILSAQHRLLVHSLATAPSESFTFLGVAYPMLVKPREVLPVSLYQFRVPTGCAGGSAKLLK